MDLPFLYHENEIKNTFSKIPESYSGEDYRALLTSLLDLENIFKSPEVSGIFCDLGAGFAQTCLYYSSLFKDRHSIAIEFVKERLDKAIAKANELNIRNITFLNQDLLTCELPHADVYFIYFSTGIVLNRVLNELMIKNNDFHLIAIESHGDLIDRLDDEMGLLKIREIPLIQERHYPNAVIYKKIAKKIDINSHDYSYLNKIICIKENELMFWASTQEMSFLKKDHFNLKKPLRTINWKNVVGIFKIDEVPKDIAWQLPLYEFGELVFMTHQGIEYRGQVVKILTSPLIGVEISSGERLEWSQISYIKKGDRLCYEFSLGSYLFPHAL